jgi:hypothetical protein
MFWQEDIKKVVWHGHLETEAKAVSMQLHPCVTLSVQGRRISSHHLLDLISWWPTLGSERPMPLAGTAKYYLHEQKAVLESHLTLADLLGSVKTWPGGCLAVQQTSLTSSCYFKLPTLKIILILGVI